MIKPHRSDGLFDFADILPTALSLAGVPGAKLADLFPKTTYIDGVDQASFLVADDGLSARRSRPYTLNQYFAAIGVDEFKYVFTAELENAVVQKGDWGGFSGSIFTDSGGVITFNLYTDPKEDVSTGVRHIPMTVPVIGAAAFYMKELIKYPPQFKIGFMSNNPPVYKDAAVAQGKHGEEWSGKADAIARTNHEAIKGGWLITLLMSAFGTKRTFRD
jgi:arylsulfatase